MREYEKDRPAVTDIARGVISISESPAELLFPESSRSMLASALGMSRAELAILSDFELFCAALDRMTTLIGSGLYEYISAAFAERLGVTPESGEDRRLLWARLCESIEEEYLRGGNGREMIGGIPSISADCDFSHYVERLCQICDAGLFVDVSALKFRRSDLYHTKKAYEDAVAGEKKDIDLFFCGIIYLASAELQKRNKCLYLYIGDNLSEASSLIGYLSERQVMPRAFLISDTDNVLSVARELCGVREGEGWRAELTPAIAYSVSDTAEYIAKTIKKLARVYPLGKLRMFTSHEDGICHASSERVIFNGAARAIKELSEDESIRAELLCTILSCKDE